MTPYTRPLVPEALSGGSAIWPRRLSPHDCLTSSAGCIPSRRRAARYWVRIISLTSVGGQAIAARFHPDPYPHQQQHAESEREQRQPLRPGAGTCRKPPAEGRGANRRRRHNSGRAKARTPTGFPVGHELVYELQLAACRARITAGARLAGRSPAAWTGVSIGGMRRRPGAARGARPLAAWTGVSGSAGGRNGLSRRMDARAGTSSRSATAAGRATPGSEPPPCPRPFRQRCPCARGG